MLRSRIRITAEGDADHPSIYNGSRIQQGRITYLSVRNPFAEKYLLDVTSASIELKNYWPQEVTGINQDGTLFDGTTKKKLPFDADVQVGHSYWLLTTREPDQCGGIVQYMVREVIKKNRRWRLYSICATVFCKETVVFFLKYHSRLTEHPVQISPLWPVFINKPYVLIHKQSPFYLLLQGQGIRTALFPDSVFDSYSTSDPDQQLICLQSIGRQQLLSVGRTKVLRYTYLWIDELNHTASTPEIKVFDIKGTAIEGEIQTNLPKERILVICSQFDGMVEVREHGKMIRRYHLKANEQTDVEVQFGYEVAAFQGLDRVLNLHFERQAKKKQYDEMTVLKRLRQCSGTQIPITHEWGSLALKYRDYPKIKRWMLERIRAGSISKSALQILKQYQKAIEREEREA